MKCTGSGLKQGLLGFWDAPIISRSPCAMILGSYSRSAACGYATSVTVTTLSCKSGDWS